MTESLYFNPGCALSLYKPDYENRILNILNSKFKNIKMHKVCCHHDPKLPKNSMIINVCAGCDRRFRSLYEGITTISLWEILRDMDDFVFPNYNARKMTIHDACPIREKSQVHKAVRDLLLKMNIGIIETKNHGVNSICCGDDFYEKIPLEKVHEKMKSRADSMPCEDVVVYCVSCIKSMHIGGKNAEYLLDLLFNENTEIQEYRTVQWHDILNKYIEEH